MSSGFHSPLWYRLSDLRPRLRPHLEVALHDYLGEPWIVLRDPLAGKVHRISARGWAVIGVLDGTRTLSEAFDAATLRLDSDAPSQPEVVELMGQLHRADLLDVDAVPGVTEALDRMAEQRKQRRQKYLRNPLSIPVPLFDPDRFLEALAPLVRGRLAGWVWLGIWLAAVLPALALLPSHGADLMAGGPREWLAMQNVLLIAAVYPAVKGLHELAHGLAVKRHGGEVHETGLMFLVFYPVPYVDASAAAFFPEKGARMLVGAAGILVELWLAAVAFLLWLALEPGLARDAMFAVMMIGGLSTVLVNGNPLLRFDGYHVMADGFEMPNLANRANAAWGWVFRAGILRTGDQRGRPRTTAEMVVFLIYAPLAFVWRLAIMVTISVMVAGQFLIVGTLLAGWSIWLGLLQPTLKLLGRFRDDPDLVQRRGRSVLLGAAVAGLAGLGLFVVPMPLWQVTEGLVWLPEDARLRAGANGELAELLQASGAVVAAGTLVARLEDPQTSTALAVEQARLTEARLAMDAAWPRDRSEWLIASEGHSRQQAVVARQQQRGAALELRSPVAGQLYLPQGDRLQGALLREGEVIGYVLPPPGAGGMVRAVLDQRAAELLQDRLRGVAVLLADQPDRPLPAQLLRRVPAVTDQLPGPALGLAGGGRIATDPGQSDGTKAFERLIVLDLAVPGLAPQRFGTRAQVKLDFGTEPPAWRLWRAGRRALLAWFTMAG